MDTPHALTTTRRDNALRRLRIITMGAAASGMAAVVGFGGLAAATNAGHTATGSVAGVASGFDGTSTAASGAAGSSGPSTLTTITRASGRGAQVTTGGS
jgi:hypothetical protein